MGEKRCFKRVQKVVITKNNAYNKYYLFPQAYFFKKITTFVRSIKDIS